MVFLPSCILPGEVRTFLVEPRTFLVEVGLFSIETKVKNTVLSASGLVDSLTGIERVQLVGRDSGNTLDASQFTVGTVDLTGGKGNDILLGGGKDDALKGDEGSNVIDGGAGK